MRSITLITKSKITSEIVSEKLIESFKWFKKIVQNDEKELFLGAFPHEFYIVFDDSSNINDPLCFFNDDDRKKIPFNDGQVNELYCREKKVMAFVLNTILEYYPEMYICDDDGNIMSAKQYIESV